MEKQTQFTTRIIRRGSDLSDSCKNSFDPEAFIAKVGNGTSISEFRKGQIVFAQGDVADAVFYLQKGKIKRTVVSEQGKEAVVGILEADQFFGEDCLGGQPFWIATATAM